MCLFYALHYSSYSEQGVGFKFWMDIEQADFTDWMSFLSSNLIEEISPNPEALSANMIQSNSIQSTSENKQNLLSFVKSYIWVISD